LEPKKAAILRTKRKWVLLLMLLSAYAIQFVTTEHIFLKNIHTSIVFNFTDQYMAFTEEV
jgi:hypothetical protein